MGNKSAAKTSFSVFQLFVTTASGHESEACVMQTNYTDCVMRFCNACRQKGRV